VRTRPHPTSTLVSCCRVVNREILLVGASRVHRMSDSPQSFQAGAVAWVRAATSISNKTKTITAALPRGTI
jgi:hypothetical protein